MENLTRFVLRHRWAVLAVWVVLLAAGGAASSGLADLLTNRFLLPGTDTAKVEDVLQKNFGQIPDGAFTVIARGAALGDLRAAAERAADELPGARVAAVQPVNEELSTALIVSELERADAKAYTGDIRAVLKSDLEAEQAWVTGAAAIESDLDPVFAEDLKVGELYIAVPIALLILAFVFGTLAFLLPFMLAAFAIPVTLGIIWIFANFMDLTTYLQNLVMLIGLGIAVDYSLLVVYRYREELRAGRSGDEALVRTMNTAGRAVVFSGTDVAIGLALMLFMPLPFMRGFGLGGLIIPAVSVLAALTVLPVLLSFLGARLDRVRFLPKSVAERRADHEANFWGRLSRAVMRRPVPIAAATTAVLLGFAAPVLDLKLGPGSNDGIPQELESVAGFNVLRDALGAGAIAPTEIVVDTRRSGGTGQGEVQAATQRLIASLEADPEVARVQFDEGSPQFVDDGRRYYRIEAAGKSDYGAEPAQQFVDRLRDDLIPAAGFPAGVEVLAGGAPAGGVDFLDLTFGAFPWLGLAVLLLTYVLLVRAFRSLLLPLKAIVMNMLSIGAAYGLLVAVFVWGLGEPFGLIQADQIEGWIPVMLFAMLFGLSMDYEVFLVSRMREEWDSGLDNEQAVANGLAKTGRIVTAAGLVMFAAFFGFVAGSVVGLQQFGFGLAVAILIDVTIVRALLVPSVMKLMGRWNWWLPKPVARALRVKPSPLEPVPVPA
jgi:putative drug exporter of the RND superfamily